MFLLLRVTGQKRGPPSLGFLANYGLKVCTQKKVTGMILAIQNNIEMFLYYLLKRTNINKTNCDSLYIQDFRVSNHFSLNKAFQVATLG